jgi:protein farnesyltransferase/geranylgeranyltransferase type-1 subunit alpha
MLMRQWLVKHFQLESALEVAFTERLIMQDILNNSAWSHRYYTLFGSGSTGAVKNEVVDREVEYAETIIKMLSSNPAPWNYLRGYFHIHSLRPALASNMFLMVVY